MYDDMEILSKRSIKLMDKLFMGMETMPREEIGQIIDKHDPELFDMMFGY
jgi:hypothetical protein